MCIRDRYINLLYFIPTAIFALIWHIKNKLIVFHKGIVATIFGIGGAVAGSYLAMAIDPWLLKKIFALLLLYIGCLLYTSQMRFMILQK